ncbi:methyltransferase domain-containing protein [Paenibacillus sp. HB172176]|uniref:class I SAM-dependent methyltransferase n=1 Tax=Paenibacillus sp. HB172176 TaxID=2493690 RepID=UPI00143BC41B|nr:methyltransferase domain-containing protein [Paenibacillus sp. HB172176]
MFEAHEWKPNLYDSKIGFVSSFGRDVVGLLKPQKGESILDLGCGTGDLANTISQAGAIVAGMDFSAEMIEKARGKYPQLRFEIGNAERFQLDTSFDAVFSNAALHWMKRPGDVIACVWNSLNSGGRFVAELGGKGNVDTVIEAIGEVLREDYQVDAAELHPWYFPSIAEYSKLLEEQGFRVAYAEHFDRPTELPDGEQGITHWLDSFAESFFKAIPTEERARAASKIAQKARKSLLRDGKWQLDYRRLRIKAIKP